MQTAYRVLVADDPVLLAKNIGNVWDSKKVLSDQSIQVRYDGKKLLPSKTDYWKMMVWDNQENVSAWSKPGTWQMGLPGSADWKGARRIAYDSLQNVSLRCSERAGKWEGAIDRPATNTFAFREIDIRPEPVGNVTFANARLQSPYGLISVRWEKKKKNFRLVVDAPANTRANICLPAGPLSLTTESGQAVLENSLIAKVGFRDGRAVYQVGSGRYYLQVRD